MISYFFQYYDKFLIALFEHLQIVFLSLLFSLILSGILTIVALYFKWMENVLLMLTSAIYSIPSLAMFAILIPMTGLGRTTAILVLVLYNQNLLVRNFLAGFQEIDKGIMDAATGMGMRKIQILKSIQIPLSKRAIFTGIRLAVVSTIGIATIAASINAGGLGTILFDGLRTMNTDKIIIGSILTASLAVLANYSLDFLEKKYEKDKYIGEKNNESSSFKKASESE